MSLLPIPPIIPAPTGLRIPGLPPGTAPAARNGAENGTTDGAAPSPQNPLGGGLLEQFGIGGGGQ